MFVSLTAIPSADALGPPRGRPDRAAAAWPCLAGRSVTPGKRGLGGWCRCPKLLLCLVPVSLSLTAIPSADALGPPRGRPDRAAAAWPRLASRSVFPGRRKLRGCRWCPAAPPCWLSGQPRCVTAARQARPRAGRSGRPRGGPRLRRGIAVSESNKLHSLWLLRRLRTKVPQTQASPDACFFFAHGYSKC